MATMLTGRILLCHVFTLSLVFLNNYLDDKFTQTVLKFYWILDVHLLSDGSTRVFSANPNFLRCHRYDFTVNNIPFVKRI